MEDCKEISTFVDHKEKVSKNDIVLKVGKPTSIVGCLMYLTATRPDILYVVSILWRFMYCSSKVHIKPSKHDVTYIKGTINYGVKFQKKLDLILLRDSESYWARSADEMKST